MESFVIMEESRGLVIRLAINSAQAVGVLKEGIGKGTGFWYAQMQTSAGRFQGVVRLQEKGNDEVCIWHRLERETAPWGQASRASKDPVLALCSDACSLSGVLKRTKSMLCNL